MSRKTYQESVKRRLNLSSELQNAQNEEQHNCTHGVDCNAETIALATDKFHSKDVKAKYTESAVTCTSCHKIYESQNYAKEDLLNAQYMETSILEQIKHVANLSDSDWDMVMRGYDAISVLTQIHRYYISMVNKMANGGGSGKKHKNKNAKSMFGVDSSMYGGRGY